MRVAMFALLVCVAGSVVAGPPAAGPPNIVFILADDLGFTDINRYAERLTGVPVERQFYETPHIDRLIREGTAFSQAYACPLCSPTRAGLLTGRNAAKIGVMTATPGGVKTYYNQGRTPPPGYHPADVILHADKITIPQALLNGSSLDALPAGQPLDQGRDEVTFAEALTGYDAAFIGKWHLGNHGAKGWQPRDHGFEELAYFDDGGSPYYNWRLLWNRTDKVFATMPQPRLFKGKTDRATDRDYLTDALTDTAVRFIEQRAAMTEAKPFVLYLCEFAVHTPFEAKREDVAAFERKGTKGWNNHDNATYAAMVKALDDSVGRILQVLADTGLESNTVVVFCSDNGGATFTQPIATCNAPLKGGKVMLFEGGIRVPLVFRRPGHIPAGQWSDVPVTYEDMFPTLLDLAAIDPTSHYARIDGRSLAPLFTDPMNRAGNYPRTTFYWHFPFNVAASNPDDGLSLAPHSAIRDGDYKLIFDWSGRLMLHDLGRDCREEQDLSSELPDKTKQLFVKLNTWLDDNVAVKYVPALNPRYDAANEARTRPFVDLRGRLLGPEKAIRTADADPRLRELAGDGH